MPPPFGRLRQGLSYEAQPDAAGGTGQMKQKHFETVFDGDKV